MGLTKTTMSSTLYTDVKGNPSHPKGNTEFDICVTEHRYPSPHERGTVIGFVGANLEVSS